MRWSIVVLTAVAGLCGTQAPAQQAPVAVGTRVRLSPVNHPNAKWIGTVLETPPDTIRILSGEDSVAISLGALRAIEVSDGIHTPAWAKYSVLYAVPAGIVTGVIVG